MRIVATGANGQLGRALKNAFDTLYPEIECFYPDIDELDITDEKALEDYLSEKLPTHVVNCAAYTAVDRAESEKEKCFTINGYAPAYLAKLSNKLGFRLVHISTDYVYPGDGNTPIKEDEAASPLNVYGESKLFADKEILRCSPSSIIIRTSGVYSPEGNNFVKTMLRLGLSDRETVEVVKDQTYAPTRAADLASAIMSVIMSGQESSGIFHYSNEGVATKFDIAHEVFSFLKNLGFKTPVLNSVGSERFPTPARRPNYSVLDLNKIKNVFGIFIPHWRDSLSEELPKIYKNL